jgi:competence protein ComEA
MKKTGNITARIVLIVFIFMMGCGRESREKLSEAGSDFLIGEESHAAAETDESPAEICVYVCGAVNAPGVYTLPAGSRVYEAVRMAGGLSDEADERAVNQAEILTDGRQVTIPTKAEVLKEEEGAAGGPVNINTAGVSELMRLSGVGESRAKDIIAYRKEHGAFSVPEDIMKVPGIKEAVFEKIKDDITVG